MATQQAIKEGSTCLLGGGLVDSCGFYSEPTVLICCRNDILTLSRKIIGPALPISTFQGLDGIIDLANDCD